MNIFYRFCAVCALIVGLTQGAAAATLPTEIATQVNTLAASGDVAGIAALAAANPSLAIDIATLAATDRADLAALIAGAIAAADPADAAAIALAVLAALPADQRDAAGPIIAAAVIQAVPGSEATLTAAGFSPAANLNSTLAAQLTAILATGFTPPSENSRQVGSPA